VLLQRVLPLEIVVIDDGSSSDNLREAQQVCEVIGNAVNIKFLTNSSSRGANFSRNRGIAVAVGEYLAFLDSDDAWLPKKLICQMTALARESRSAGSGVLCYTGRYRASEGGEIIARQGSNRTIPQHEILFTNFIGTLSSVVVDRTSVVAAGGFDEGLSASQDWDLYIRLMERVKFVRVPKPLCVYYDHGQPRISASNRVRVRANIALRRKHALDGRKLSARADYCRMMAEDLQLAGREKLARRFYLQHLLLARRGKPLGRLVDAIASTKVLLLGLPNVRRERYAGYRRNLARLLRSEEAKSSLLEDQHIILKLQQTSLASFGTVRPQAIPSRTD
jgi:glycosyltransferase involved in cell wall biosynthesis